MKRGTAGSDAPLGARCGAGGLGALALAAGLADAGVAAAAEAADRSSDGAGSPFSGGGDDDGGGGGGTGGGGFGDEESAKRRERQWLAPKSGARSTRVGESYQCAIPELRGPRGGSGGGGSGSDSTEEEEEGVFTPSGLVRVVGGGSAGEGLTAAAVALLAAALAWRGDCAGSQSSSISLRNREKCWC